MFGVSCPVRIHVSDCLCRCRGGDLDVVGVVGQDGGRKIGEGWMESGAPVVQAIVNGIAKVAENSFYCGVVNTGRFGVILGEFDDGVEDVGSAGDGSKQQFTDGLAVAKLHLGLKLDFSVGVGGAGGKLEFFHILLIMIHG